MLIGASLKMYFGRARTLEWTRAVAAICAEHPAVRQRLVEPFVIPSFPSIPEVVAAVNEAGATAAGMLVGAQDLHWEDAGAFTGEVSAPELAEHGVTLAEIGHAERRRMFGETDATAARKVAAALRHGIAPVLCIGEDTRGDAVDAAAACIAQLEACVQPALEQELFGRLIVAYEPVWAIGAPEPAADDHIRAIGTALREHLASLPFDAQVIYGGSAGPGLLPRIADSVDGMFLGRFAHEPEAFRAILDEALALEVRS